MTDTEMILEQIKNIQEAMGRMQENMENMQENMENMQESMEKKIDDFKSEMLDEFQKQNETLDEKSAEIDRHLRDTEHNLKIYMENAVDKRMTALREGREIDQEYIDRNMRTGRHNSERIDDLETRVAVLESKTSA